MEHQYTWKDFKVHLLYLKVGENAIVMQDMKIPSKNVMLYLLYQLPSILYKAYSGMAIFHIN